MRNVLLHAGEKLTNSGFLGASGKLTIEVMSPKMVQKRVQM
ncbi:filamentous hemagglutinin domain protein [Bordetella holmesii 70147]|nr:filamentous hemagglutinin domain protein [Bordetella holmesii 70147]